MTTLTVITRDGTSVRVTAAEGATVMEAIRDSEIDEMLALCGGSCSCATCHVYVDPAFAARLPAMGANESDMLDASAHRNGRSRLSCQLPVSDALNGMTVTLAPEE